MRRLKRSVNRHKNRWMSSMTSIALATVLAAGGSVSAVQQVYAAEQEAEAETKEDTKEETADSKEQKKEIAVYLDCKEGDDKAKGTTAEEAVKTWKKAMKLAKKSGASVIYVSSTIEVDTSAEWILKNYKIKRAEGFDGVLISVEKDAVLKIYGQKLKKKDVEVGENAELISQKDIPKDVLKKESIDSELENLQEETSDSKEQESLEEETVAEPEQEESAKQPAESEQETPVEQPTEPEQETPAKQPAEPEQETPAKQPAEPETETSEEKTEEPKQETSGEKTEESKQEASEEKTEESKQEASEEKTEEPKKEESAEQPDAESSEDKENQETADETVQDTVTKEDKALLNQELALQAAASITEAIEQAEAGDVYQLVEATKEFEALALDVQELISQDVKDELTVAQESAKLGLLSCEGLTVTGTFLPWYVQFIVEIKDGVNLETADVSTLLSSYDLKLWDLMTDTEYEIPEGEKVTVTMKAPDMGLYQDIVIVHTLKDGSKEYITPVIEGEWLHFETSSFSPFDVAGNKVIVGVQFPDDTASNSSGSLISGNGTSSNSTSSGNSTNSSSATNNSSTVSSSTTKNSSSAASSSSTKSSSTSKTSSVKTGDVTVVFPYLLSAGAATIGVAAAGRKKKSEEE